MDWNDFAKRLTLELSRLPVQSFIIVQAPSGMPYVQAMRADQGMDAEAVGSAFLPRPLGHLQERRLRSLGWEPPDDQRRRNWWDHFDLRDPGRRDRDGRAAAERLEACAMLAGRMVGAFRDVYGVDSPLELVYQAARIGKEGGPLALPGLGIPVAIPEGGERRTERPSGSALETALADARERGDQRGYLELLARAPLYLPAPNNPGGTDHQYATAQFGDGTFILAFTSPEAMERSLQGQAVHHREESLARLARRWPNPRWQLAVNPGLPSASYLDANALFEPEHAEPPRQTRRIRKPGRRRAAPHETPVDPVPARAPQANGHTPPPSEDPPGGPPAETAPSAPAPPVPTASTPSTRGAAPREGLAGGPGDRSDGTAPRDAAPYPTGPAQSPGAPRSGAPSERGGAPRDGLAGPSGGRPAAAAASGADPYPTSPAQDSGAAPSGEPNERGGAPREGLFDSSGGRPTRAAASGADPHPTGPTETPGAPRPGTGEPSARGGDPRDGLPGSSGGRPVGAAPRDADPYPTSPAQRPGAARSGEPSASDFRDGLFGSSGGRPAGAAAGGADPYSADPAEAPGTPPTGRPGDTTAGVAAGAGDDALAGAAGAPDGFAASAEDVAAGRQIVVMQKVVRGDHVQHYLEGGYDLVAGYVHRFEDVRGLGTPAVIVRALGLVYEGSPFTPADEQVFVIRWAAVKPPLFRRPLGGIDEWSMGIVPGGWVIEKAPFPGSGYAPGEGPSIPEFKIDSQRLPHGAELYRLDAQGTERLVAVFDADLRRWHVKLPGGRA